MERIVEGKVRVEKYGKSTEIKKEIYVNCDCESLAHLIRVWCEKIDDRHVSVDFEFNGSKGLYPKWTPPEIKILAPISRLYWKVSSFCGRIRAAWSLIRKNEIWFGSNFELNGEDIVKFADILKKTVRELEDYEV